MSPNRTRVVVVGHGSRDPEANAELEALVAAWRTRRPDLEISVGYVELAEPSLAHALDSAAGRPRHAAPSPAPCANPPRAQDADALQTPSAGAAEDRDHAAARGERAERVVALPLFLFSAGHVKNDLPLALQAARANHPGVRFVAARALGVHPKLAELLAARVAIDPAEAGKTAVVVVGRGASDPDANGDFHKLVSLFAQGRGFAQVAPCFIGITRPLVPETLEQIARARPEKLVVAPYMLFSGRLITKLEDQVAAFRQLYPWIATRIARHLGAHETLFELMDARVAEALDGGAPLPCDTCQYRTELPGRAHEVGGLGALLWSLRHGYTHTQAVPHQHAHKPVRKHVLVCGNVDCADRGSIALIETLRGLIKDAGRQLDIKVTRTSCMGRCGEGPTVVIYPDGIWYRGVRDGDARELVGEHLLRDRLVARLVDNIMQ
jgi:sirohydrochlorin cobaltochelatase